ncbi:MAG: CHAT domain-containing protein, partial [Planktothrix sp.]|uniref:CHAT domain-containing protein n=1 Tax=Planktothrix sp. TaxID=3088171 RepID=UPI0038D4B8C3
MNNILEFEITIGRKFNNYWPINVRINDNGMRRDLLDLKLNLDCKQLRAKTQDKEYGEFLGQALFDNDSVKLLRDSFKEALGKSREDCPLRILLSIDNAEDLDLKAVEWQKLCAPIDGDESWSPLALDQRVPFSMYIPTAISTTFPLLRQNDLRALVLVASPDNLREGLAHFDAKQVVLAMQKSLGDIPHKFLVNNVNHSDCIGAPTLKNLCQQLTDAKPRYNLLHIVCHGTLDQDRDTTLYWADENNKESLLSGEELIEELKKLPVPHFTFLCTCNSAAAQAEVAKVG